MCLQDLRDSTRKTWGSRVRAGATRTTTGSRFTSLTNKATAGRQRSKPAYQQPSCVVDRSVASWAHQACDPEKAECRGPPACTE